MKKRVSEQIYELNKRRTLYLMYESEEPLSRPEIAKRLKISLPAVSNIMDGLVTDGLILDVGIEDTSRGRKPALYSINKNAFHTIGIKIAFNRGNAVLLNASGEIINKIDYQFKKEISFDNLMNIITEQCQQLLEEANENADSLMGISIAFPAPLSLDNKLIRSRFYGWKDINLPEKLKIEGVKIPLTWENDANVLALGYSRFLKQPNLLAAVLDIGIGVGITMNGRMFKGPNGQAGEIGQTLVSNNYPLEVLLIEKTLVAFSKEFLKHELHDRIKILDEMEKAKDTEKIQEIYRRASRKLGEVLSVAAITLDTDIIVLSGSLVVHCPTLVHKVAEQINHFSSFKKEVLVLNTDCNPTALGGHRLIVEKTFNLEEI